MEGDLNIQRNHKINYYLDIAETISERGTCLRKNFGAIIVKNDEIISTGYTGAPRGRKNCIDLGVCTTKKFSQMLDILDMMLAEVYMPNKMLCLVLHVKT